MGGNQPLLLRSMPPARPRFRNGETDRKDNQGGKQHGKYQPKIDARSVAAELITHGVEKKVAPERNGKRDPDQPRNLGVDAAE